MPKIAMKSKYYYNTTFSFIRQDDENVIILIDREDFFSQIEIKDIFFFQPKQKIARYLHYANRESKCISKREKYNQV